MPSYVKERISNCTIIIDLIFGIVAVIPMLAFVVLVILHCGYQSRYTYYQYIVHNGENQELKELFKNEVLWVGERYFIIGCQPPHGANEFNGNLKSNNFFAIEKDGDLILQSVRSGEATVLDKNKNQKLCASGDDSADASISQKDAVSQQNATQVTVTIH